MNDKQPIRWRKSSHSGHSGGECVEVAGLATMVPDDQWRKSSRSDHHGGECVEVADLVPSVAVRDSKDPHGPKLILDRAAFTAFVDTVRAGAHDLI